jgi:hypothetical protein
MILHSLSKYTLQNIIYSNPLKISACASFFRHLSDIEIKRLHFSFNEGALFI